MTDPRTTEGTEASLKPAIEHAVCPDCSDQGYEIALCGTPIPEAEIRPFGTPVDAPCIVCFATQVTTCNRCGTAVTIWL